MQNFLSSEIYGLLREYLCDILYAHTLLGQTKSKNKMDSQVA